MLNEGELETLLKDPKLKPRVLSTYFDIRKGLDGSLDSAIKALCEEADAAVRSGCQLLVLSDRSEAPVSTVFFLQIIGYLRPPFLLHFLHIQNIFQVVFHIFILKMYLQSKCIYVLHSFLVHLSYMHCSSLYSLL